MQIKKPGEMFDSDNNNKKQNNGAGSPVRRVEALNTGVFGRSVCRHRFSQDCLC